MNAPTCLQRSDLAPPQIFISSTMDARLDQIRESFRVELETMNYLALMSELGTFSHAHGKKPIYEDTVDTVAASQFYILIIGRRYGTVHPVMNSSITELEYEAARKARLPVLVYVERSVWEGYHAFEDGAVRDAKHWVEDPRVFEFLRRVANEHACRCVPFSYAHEIIGDFKSQMANLLGGYLRFELRTAPWLWTEPRTRQIERAADVIWVLTPNFFWDYTDSEYRDLVFENVTERRARYYYLYRAGTDNDRRIDEMARSYEAAIGLSSRKLVHYTAVPEPDFNWCTEQGLFDPGHPTREHGLLVDVMDGRDLACKHNIQLGREKLSEFRRQFERLWRRYGHGTPWPEAEDGAADSGASRSAVP